MAKTVAEVLKETGLTDEQIAALDPKAITAFTTVVTSAQQTLDEAENRRRLQAEQYDKEITPALNNWANEKAANETKMAAYAAALKSAEEGGFKVPDLLKTPVAPPAPAHGEGGRFVPGPGSPKFVTEDVAYKAISAANWVQNEYMRLHNGAPPPDDLDVLDAESKTARMPFKDYVSKKYDFPGKREAIRQAEQKKHDDGIAAAAVAEAEKKWVERHGSNPMVRQAEVSKFSALDKAVKAGERPDPMKLTREQRHQQTREFIQKDIAASSVQ